MGMPHKSYSLQYVEKLQEIGISTFSTRKLQFEFGLSPVAARATLRRLREARKIATPLEGFHVILTPSDRRIRCLPADQFIDHLMSYLNEPYYVGLLSAAELYSAAHQKPQVFQVFTENKRRQIRCGLVHVEFIVRQNLQKMPTAKITVRTGYIRTASPETTAFDLVGYWKRAGGLDNVATILIEMNSKLRAREFARIAPLSPIAWAQRLGFILDEIGAARKAEMLAQFVAKNARLAAPLLSGKSFRGSPLNKRWKIYVNTTIEPDKV